ncbi:MAG TPA: Na+/H+ antiporter subunit G [Halothiobacillus sp.]|nr:Na+/H+ antiporter subunit G [Halothiobacillus sp.]
MTLADLAIAGLIVLGSLFVLLGSIGLVKFPDFFMRLHAPTKASTLGVTAILLASALFFSFRTDTPSVHEVLIIVFLWVTAPISALMLASAARHEPSTEPEMLDRDSGSTMAPDKTSNPRESEPE